MSTHLTKIDVDTRLGALKRETHWTLVLAGTGGGLTFTWVGHLMEWTPLGFTVHGIAGVVGGYLVGTGVARAVTGARVRAGANQYALVSMPRRVVSSTLRIGIGACFFAFSYLFAVGLDLAALLASGQVLFGTVFGAWALIFLFALLPQIIRAAR